MIKRFIPAFVAILTVSSCYTPERDCKSFKDGTFTFTTEINGESKTTRFVRSGNMEVDYFEGKADTSEIRWLNDCEYIIKKLNPKNRAEEASLHMKILTTTDSSYTFEYAIVGSEKKSKGTAIKID